MHCSQILRGRLRWFDGRAPRFVARKGRRKCAWPYVFSIVWLPPARACLQCGVLWLSGHSAPPFGRFPWEFSRTAARFSQTGCLLNVRDAFRFREIRVLNKARCV